MSANQSGGYRELVHPASSDSDSDVEALGEQRPILRHSESSTSREGARQSVSQGRTLPPPVLTRRPSLSQQVSHQVADRVPPEWSFLLLGCGLGCATGLSVVAFNKGVHGIHDLAWAGTPPHEGAAWLRVQKLKDTWHRIMILPVVGGVLVGLMHSILGILDQLSSIEPRAPRKRVDWIQGAKPVVKAVQAATTLGTGCSLGPEGPSVDIGKAWAHGCANVMKNNKERRVALAAAGAAAGIASGFNAPVAGCFFAIETVLRPAHAENSPPLTTAMIILASVISSTVSQVVLGESPAFTVPTYELKSAAELPLYLFLGMLCGVVSVILTRLIAYWTRWFDFLKDRIGIPLSITPALGGLCTGLIALKYPGVLYWGFTNVDEILHSGKTASAPGAGLLVQLTAAKIIATSICRGSGLVGGVYAPSLFIGSAVGSVYGSIAGKAINAAIPDGVAHPQAYALVGMAALLAAVCSVPLTSVLLLFELTKDYHILLPLMGAVGLAIWVASIAKDKNFPALQLLGSVGIRTGVQAAPMSPTGHDSATTGNDHSNGGAMRAWRKQSAGDIELISVEGQPGPEMILEDELLDTLKVSQAMSKGYVKVLANATVKETVASMIEVNQKCALVVDDNDLLEGIFTLDDLQREVFRAMKEASHGEQVLFEVDSILVASICTDKGDGGDDEGNIVVAYPDLTLREARDLMEPRRLHHVPVAARGGKRWQDRGRKVVGLLDRDSIPKCLRKEAAKRIEAILARPKDDDDDSLDHGH